jgi:hypothetical protein
MRTRYSVNVERALSILLYYSVKIQVSECAIGMLLSTWGGGDAF